MPLSSGSSKGVVSQNIHEFHTGKTYARTAAKFGKERANAQAIAVALANARRHPGKALGGPIAGVVPAALGSSLGASPMMGGLSQGLASNPMGGAPMGVAGASAAPFQAGRGFAGGGMPMSSVMPHLGRSSLPHTSLPSVHVGPIRAAVPGRTDHVPLKVPKNSYVVPADVVSGLGEGNSEAGHRAINGMFKSAPMGAALPNAGRHGIGLPHAPKPGHFAAGGSVDNNYANPIDIMAAGGEHVLSPEQVLEAGFGDYQHGHDSLDKWVKLERKKNIETQKRLPSPVKD